MASDKLNTLHEMPSPSSDFDGTPTPRSTGGSDDEAARTNRCGQERLPRRLVLNGDATMTQRRRYRTHSGEVLTNDELRQRLTAELKAMNRRRGPRIATARSTT